MRTAIRAELAMIEPYDSLEQEHLAEALTWVDSGAELCRTSKPARVDPLRYTGGTLSLSLILNCEPPPFRPSSLSVIFTAGQSPADAGEAHLDVGAHVSDWIAVRTLEGKHNRARYDDGSSYTTLRPT